MERATRRKRKAASDLSTAPRPKRARKKCCAVVFIAGNKRRDLGGLYSDVSSRVGRNQAGSSLRKHYRRLIQRYLGDGLPSAWQYGFAVPLVCTASSARDQNGSSCARLHASNHRASRGVTCGLPSESGDTNYYDVTDGGGSCRHRDLNKLT